MNEQSGLIDRMRRGDEEAFRVFFNGYYPRLTSFVASRSSLDAASIEDVVQTTLVKAMRSLSSYRGDASLFTWLCAICWREFLTMRRRERRHLGSESLDALPARRLAQLRAPEQWEPDFASESEYDRTAIATTLSALPEHYARALKMKYVEGRAVDDLAVALGITVLGAQSLLARARAAFRLASPGADLGCHRV